MADRHNLSKLINSNQRQQLASALAGWRQNVDIVILADTILTARETLFERLCNILPRILAKCSPNKIENLDFTLVNQCMTAQRTRRK